MGFLPGFENDVFISYAHIDNEPVIQGKPGWVEFFEDLLRKRVRVRLGGEIAIFRDPQLRRFGEFSEQLAGNLSRSAVFLCVLSPRYVGSDWCLWELEQFIRQSGNNRIVKIAKTAFDQQSLHPKAKPLLDQLNQVLDCRFYKKDESSGLFTDLQPEVIPDHIPAFIQQVDIIAQNLIELFKQLRAAAPSLPTGAPQTESTIEVAEDSRPAVYLAETIRELEDARNNVCSELRQFNYRVLPDEPLPHNPRELSSKVRGYLQEAKFAIHLVGSGYGAVPEDETRSIPHLQYDLAAEMSREGKITQMIWLTPDLLPKDERQAAFVNDLRKLAPNYLQTLLEDLKTEIRKKLEVPEEDKEPANICLCYHIQDFDSVSPLFRYLTLQELFSVKLLDDSEPNHKQALRSAHGVLLYHGFARLDWVLNRWRLIQRYTSVGRASMAMAKAIYAGPPPDDGKDMLLADSTADDVLVIGHYGEFSPNLLAPFIERIKAARGDER